MISAEPETMPETVPFSSSVKILPEDKVENWLTKIQEMMITTLFDLMGLAYKEYPTDALNRND